MIAIIGFLYDVFHDLACGEVPEVGFVFSMQFYPNDTRHGSASSWFGFFIPGYKD